VEPNDYIIVEGLFPLYSKLARACFDVTVFLDPLESTRREWKIKRDTRKRGYTADQVLAELDAREPESEAFIRPQRQHADIVVRFAPVQGRDDPSIPLSAELMLRPTIRHPDLSEVIEPGLHRAMHLKLERDTDGRPVDTLHIHGYVDREESVALEKAIWKPIGEPGSAAPECLGRLGTDGRSAPLAITQLLLMHHLVEAGR
jgi:phosphoribulokinase